MLHVSQRVEFGDLCAARRIRRAVEVGTDCGVFASEFFDRWNQCAQNDARPECLVCVDPWAPYGYMPFDRTPDLLMAVTLLARCRDRVRLLRATSAQAAAYVPTSRYHSPGFVYIDGDHAYEVVRADLDAWWPVVVSGGILAGHDYTADADGVRRAVNELVARHDLALFLTDSGAEEASWWVVKP